MTRQQHCTVLFFVFKSETRIKTPKRSELSDEDFLKWLISIGGTPPELLANPEVFKLFLPALKADLHVVENYRWADSCLLLNLLLTFLKPSVDVVSDGVADLSADVTRRAARFSPARSRVLTGRMTFLMIYKVSALTGQEGAVHYSYGYYIDLNANCYFVLLPSLLCPQQSSV